MYKILFFLFVIFRLPVTDHNEVSNPATRQADRIVKELGAIRSDVDAAIMVCR